MKLLHDNTFRAPWLVAKRLSTDKALAKGSVAALVKHLVTTRPGNRTSFEHHMLTHVEVSEILEDASKAAPPVCLWGNKGQYESLFKLFCHRFLFWPLAMSWMQRGSMLNGSGPVI